MGRDADVLLDRLDDVHGYLGDPGRWQWGADRPVDGAGLVLGPVICRNWPTHDPERRTRRRDTHGGFDGGSDVVVEAAHQVPVPVHRGLDALVPEPNVNGRQRDPGRDHPRRVRVTQIMNPRPLRQPLRH